MTNTINRAELTGIAAALTNKYTKMATDIYFFFWWGLLHGPQQGPDRMKEKNLKDWEKENSCLKRKTLLEKTTV
jgi:hypothetical protein